MSPMQQPVLDPLARPQQQAARRPADPQHSSSCRTGRHSTSPGQAPASSATQQSSQARQRLRPPGSTQQPLQQQNHKTHSRTAGSSHSGGLQEAAVAAALLARLWRRQQLWHWTRQTQMEAVNQQLLLLLQDGRAARTTCETGRKFTSKQQVAGVEVTIVARFLLSKHDAARRPWAVHAPRKNLHCAGQLPPCTTSNSEACLPVLACAPSSLFLPACMRAYPCHHEPAMFPSPTHHAYAEAVETQLVCALLLRPCCGSCRQTRPGT